MTRDILNHLGKKIGELELPDGTSEEVWTEKLSVYATPPPTQYEAQTSYLKHTIKARKAYAEDLLERLKQRNISQRINVSQGLWMHSRMRAVPINFNGLEVSIDVMNLAVSGDIEIACVTLQYTTPDDMTQPYHWWSQERINWIINDMKAYLGWA